MPGTVIQTGPAEEPLTLTEAKLHLRVTNNVENTKISNAIIAARNYIEGFTGPIVTQTVDEYFNTFPACDWLTLSYGNVQSITSIEYTDSSGATAAVSASTYQLSALGKGRPSSIHLKYNQEWPSVTLATVDAVKVRYVAGFGLAAAVPQEIKQAMLLLLGHFHSNREEELRGNNTVPSSLRLGVFSLISEYRI